MPTLTRAAQFTALAAIILAFCGFAANTSTTALPDLIVTSAPTYNPTAALSGGERFPQGARLFRIHKGKAEPLLPNFAASADARVSYDGASVLFAAKKSSSDHWSIYDLNLASGATRLLVSGPFDAIRPLYLPGGQLLFARRAAQGFELVVAAEPAIWGMAPIPSDAGKTLRVISAIPGNAIPADVLQDGRILFESTYPIGLGATPEMYLVYTDGSGVESYRCDHGNPRWGGRQIASGDVVLTRGATLARFTSPLAREDALPAPRAEYAGGIAETASGDLLVSTRSNASTPFALQLWHRAAAAFWKTIFASDDANILDPVLITSHPRPNHHPSGLHDWSYANLLALDARASRDGDLKELPATVRLEMLDNDNKPQIIGTAPIAEDGSFFIQVAGNRPIRLALLDAKGAVIRQERGFFWSAPGEQRYCVGCHTGPERSSENRVPAVLLHSTKPVVLPSQAPTQSTAGGN